MTGTTWIVPTFNNARMLGAMLDSFIAHTARGALDHRDVGCSLVVVNNGTPGLQALLNPHPCYRIVEAGDNLGWEGGLQRGLEEVTTDYVGFLNDDLHIVAGNPGWMEQMASVLEKDATVGAVGPLSNFVMGFQYMHAGLPPLPCVANLLIGFCMLLRREALDKAGGVQGGLPGGDDFDLSIRLRKSGYRLVIHGDVFVFHYGSQTGARVHPGIWNSPQMISAAKHAIIRKHSLRDYLDCIQTLPVPL